jgi:hypothetical protein
VRLASGAAGLLACVGLQMAYNARLTGDPLASPFAVYWPPDRLGFGPLRGQGPAVGQWDGPWVEAHTPWRALRILGSNLAMLDRWLLGFQGSLALLAALVLIRLRAAGCGAERGLLLAALLLQPLLYMLLWFEGLNHTGPIYYFEVLLPLAVLGGWALAGLSWRPALALPAALLAAAVATAGWSWRIAPALAPLQAVTRLQERDVQQIRATVQPPAVVFLPQRHLGEPLASLVNGPEPLEQPIVYALDRGEQNRELLQRLSGRQAWRLVRLPAEPRPIGWRIELVRVASNE